MSKVLENLQEQLQTFLNQRSSVKDQLENLETNITNLKFALDVQEAISKEEEAAAEVVVDKSNN